MAKHLARLSPRPLLVAALPVEVEDLPVRNQDVARGLGGLRVGGEDLIMCDVCDAEEGFRHVEPADGGLDAADDAGDASKRGVLLAIAPAAHGLLQRRDLPEVPLRRVHDVLLQGEGELFHLAAQAAK